MRKTRWQSIERKPLKVHIKDYLSLQTKKRILDVMKTCWIFSNNNLTKHLKNRHELSLWDMMWDSPRIINVILAVTINWFPSSADYMKALRREDFKPQYFMTREQSREKHQHHHGILLLEGKKVHCISTPLDIAERIWHHKLVLPPPTGKFFQKDTSQEHLIDACIRDRQGNIVPQK